MEDKKWIVTNNDSSFATLRDKNTVYTISNGYYAIKGNVHEYKNVDYPATYIAGVWGYCPIFKLESPTKYHRVYHDYNQYDVAEDRTSIANLPDPLMLEIFVANHQMTFQRGKITNFSQNYYLDCGLYQYCFEHESADGKKTKIRVERFADMQNLHRAYLRYTIKPVNYCAEIMVRTGIDGTTRSNALDEKQYKVAVVQKVDENTLYMRVKTFPNQHDAELFTSHTVTGATYTKTCCCEEERGYDSYVFSGVANQEIVIDKFIILGSSEDERYGVAVDLADEMSRAVRSGFETALAEQRKFWDETWRIYDLQIAGDNLAQIYIRFCMFHLVCGLPRHSNRLFIPVKLLTGDHYQGTAFYDTDLYIEPVFLALDPGACRNLITFRYNILDKSREIARSLGCRGAKYAWQVDPAGQEILGSWWRLRETNIHLNVDIVYSIMNYYYATGDIDFMVTKAVDIMVEVSRFMMDRSEYDATTDTYHIDKVAGPDESHCNSKNNFYTNYLTKQCWMNTVNLLAKIKMEYPEEYHKTVQRLSIEECELQAWENAAAKIVILFDPETKLYEQAEGFFKLPLISQERWDAFRIENKPKAGMWFADLDKYGQTNQPDASAVLWMYPGHFDVETYRINYEFYNRRNCNFSSMSFAVNSMMAKQVGDMEAAYRNFLITAGMDLDPTLTNRLDTRAGLHGTALAGGWMAIVNGFAGLMLGEDHLAINPKLPAHWEKLSFNYCYRGELLQFEITQTELRIAVDLKKNQELKIEFQGRPVQLKSGEWNVMNY